VTLHDRRDFVDVIKLKILRWWDNSGISGWVQSNPYTGKQKDQRERFENVMVPALMMKGP